jgi:hypothetical protein
MTNVFKKKKAADQLADHLMKELTNIRTEQTVTSPSFNSIISAANTNTSSINPSVHNEEDNSEEVHPDETLSKDFIWGGIFKERQKLESQKKEDSEKYAQLRKAFANNKNGKTNNHTSSKIKKTQSSLKVEKPTEDDESTIVLKDKDVIIVNELPPSKEDMNEYVNFEVSTDSQKSEITHQVLNDEESLQNKSLVSENSQLVTEVLTEEKLQKESLVRSQVQTKSNSVEKKLQSTQASKKSTQLSKKENPASQHKVNSQQTRTLPRSLGPGPKIGADHFDAALAQAENLQIAQSRIHVLEEEIDRLRFDNEELASAGEVFKKKKDELELKIKEMEKDFLFKKSLIEEEKKRLKEIAQQRETQVEELQQRVEQLEVRLGQDFKKIRIRERELENRLELAKMEKAAVVKIKDEKILELKRSLDHIQDEVDSYRSRAYDLNKTSAENQEQVKRTVRALRLALSNLEEDEDLKNKKAE